MQVPIRNIEIFLNLLFWTITSWVIVQLFSIKTQEIEVINGVERIIINRPVYIVYILMLGQALKAIFFYVNFFFITWDFLQRKQLWRFALIAAAMFAAFILAELGLSKLFFLPPREMLNWQLTLGLYLFYFATSSAYGFIKVWNKNEQEKQQLAQEKKAAELQLLRAQLHPHFLFNTLNNLLSMAEKSANPQLTESITRLSGLLRYLLYETQHAKVSLAKEIDFIRDFIELHLIRYGDEDELDVSLHVQGDIANAMIEPGLLIPFVENAFKYGVRPEIKSSISLKIDTGDPETIYFQASNTIHADQPSEIAQTGGIGLRNIRKRLQLIYPGRHELTIEEGNMYIVNLRIKTNEHSDR